MSHVLLTLSFGFNPFIAFNKLSFSIHMSFESILYINELDALCFCNKIKTLKCSEINQHTKLWKVLY